MSPFSNYWFCGKLFNVDGITLIDDKQVKGALSFLEYREYNIVWYATIINLEIKNMWGDKND